MNSYWLNFLKVILEGLLWLLVNVNWYSHDGEQYGFT